MQVVAWHNRHVWVLSLLLLAFIALSCQEKRKYQAQISSPSPKTALKAEKEPVAQRVCPLAWNTHKIKCPKSAKLKSDMAEDGCYRFCIKANGKRHGSYIGWHYNGNIKIASNYDNGLAHGKNTTWYESGEKNTVMHFWQGKPDGKVVTWNKQGVKTFEGNFLWGQPHGRVFSWHGNGKVGVRGRMRFGNKHGRWDYWNVVGRKIKSCKYDRGKLLSCVPYGGRTTTDQRRQPVRRNQPTRYRQPAIRRTCCKICTTGCACGDSCINCNYTCRRGPGCACNYQ